jgi:glycine/D-amino acid oxidase-like deaminating enzyme
MGPQVARSNGRVIVVGAGIVGTCCALFLQREGFRVTLMDHDEPGSGCSAGNAGLIHSGSVLPLATPGILRRVPGMLTDPDGPLLIRWRYLPALLPWLLRLARNAAPARVEATSRALVPLLRGAMEAYRTFIPRVRIHHLFKDQGELYVFRGEDAGAEIAAKLALYQTHGIAAVELGAAALREREPALSSDYTRGYHLPGSVYTVDPRGLTRALAAGFVAEGGELLRAQARGVARRDRGVVVETSGPSLTCGRLVVAAGAYSRPLARQAGIDVPLETLRGYHLELPSAGVRLNGPVIEGAMNFGVTPMAKGVRLAGTVEFAGLHAPPNWRRADMLLRLAKTMLPALDGRNAIRWMGHRPSLPDSLPMIGPVPQWPAIWFAFGHGQLGLTTAAITGRLIADAMAGRTPGIDLSPFRVDRFMPLRGRPGELLHPS